jgi:hypothetical protein
MKKSIKRIIYLTIAFIVLLVYSFYVEPKPIESIRQITLVIAYTLGLMIGSFVFSVIPLLLLMIFVKSVRKEFWNLVALIMMAQAIIWVLVNIFG